MQVFLLLSLVAATFAAPRADNALTCSICVDIITELDNFITDATTEEQIVEYAKEICHLLGSVLGEELEDECNTMIEENLPGIIEGIVNDLMDPMDVCTSIGTCP